MSGEKYFLDPTTHDEVYASVTADVSTHLALVRSAGVASDRPAREGDNLLWTAWRD